MGGTTLNQLKLVKTCIKHKHLNGCKHFSSGRGFHGSCIETIADAEQQLDQTVLMSRFLLGVERLQFSIKCSGPYAGGVRGGLNEPPFLGLIVSPLEY